MYLARALEDAGFAVTVLTANGTSARCRARTVEWISGPHVATSELVPHVDRLMPDFDRVLPLTERAMRQLWAAPHAWIDRVFPAVEPWQGALVLDKHAVVEHMAARGLATPRHVDVAAAGELGLPVVIKGATGSGGRMVHVADTRAELAAALEKARVAGGRWIAQEYIAGPTFLFGGVFDRGRPLRIYAAEKLELHPARTGGAIRVRSRRDPDLVAAGLAAMRELAWTGFASADFMRGADGRYLLLEINPRLWGSLAGALAAGVDLFAPFCELLAGETPRADLAFADGVECLIFPRYLNARAHRTLAGLRRAWADLRGEQGRDWRDPRFVAHVLHRLYWMRRHAERM